MKAHSHPLHGTSEIVVFDFETTGRRAARDEITEIAAFRMGGIAMEVGDAFQTLVDPGRPIPLHIQKITHLTDEDVRGAPQPLAALRELARFVGESTLLGHDIYRFDFKFIRKHLGEDGSSRRKVRFIDTMDIFQLMWPDFSRLDHGLDEIAARLNVSIPRSKRHRAGGDALLLAKIFQRIQADPEIHKIIEHVPVHEGELPTFLESVGLN